MKILQDSKRQLLHPIISKILQSRGIKTHEDIEDYFSWDLKSIPSLTSLIDLEKASERSIRAIKNDEKIAIYGDYDVDGTTSCALLFHFFQMLDVTVELFQPSRFIEGYGVHPSSIDQALEKGIGLVITVDCGISNIETAEYALSKNIDLIITDHHKDAKEHIPRAYAVINPNRRDETCHEDLKALAGVGVAFALALQIKEDLAKEDVQCPSIYPLLQFYALGTICDLAKLNNTNKKLVRHGLKVLQKTNIPGLKLFMKPADYQKPMVESQKCSFDIGPHINSRGRLEHPEFALNMITDSNSDKALGFYNEVVKSNIERKKIQKEVYDQAFEQVQRSWSVAPQKISIAYSETWHEGVIGIVASKLVETFRVPAIVFTSSEEKGILKASARTAGTLNLFDLLDSTKDLFLKFGGHKAAAGLSMKREHLSQLREHLNRELDKIPEIIRTKQNEFDIEVSMRDLDLDLALNLQKMEPFGMGNPYPVFRIKDAFISEYKILKDSHVKWTLSSRNAINSLRKSVNAISFFYLNSWEAISPDDLMKKQKEEALVIDGKLQINYFNNKRYLQILTDKISTEFDSSIL